MAASRAISAVAGLVVATLSVYESTYIGEPVKLWWLC